MPLSPGDKLGPYEIVAPLGAGGMGEVYRARDGKLNRDVAIKVLPAALANDAQYMARFEREAQMLATQNHPNIATVYGIDQGALVMELVEGADLKGPLPLEEAIAIARQIAAGLEAAHEKGIIHRDLKPANIKLTPAGVVKILDFGLAKSARESSAASAPTQTISPTLSLQMTQAGMILGTAAYMSPEQARGRPVDKRTDIWAFGVVLYEIITAKRLFEGEDLTETLAAVVKDRPDLSAVPPSVRPLLERCLEKDPRKRLRDIGDFELLLAAPSAPAALATMPRSGRLLWIAAAGLMTAVAVVALWALWRATQPVERPLVRLDVDLGADVSLPAPSAGGTAVAISPDGTRLAYVAGTNSGATTKLFTRRLDQPKATELPATEGATAPFFSPDGRWLGFYSGGKMSKISVEGGAIVPLGDFAVKPGASWGDDGAIFLNSVRKGLRIPAAGGPPETVTESSNDELGFDNPQILPGSKAVLLAVDHPGPVDKTTIEVLTLADHRRKILLRGGASPRYLAAPNGAGYLVYVNHAALFAVPFDLDKLEIRGTAIPVLQDVANERLVGTGQWDISRTGTLVYRRTGGSVSEMMTLQWVYPNGKSEPLRATPNAYARISLSPEGTRVALSIMGGGSQDLWVFDPHRDSMTRLTFGGVNNYMAWSPDGRSVVFANVGNGIFQARADGAGQPEMLTQSKILLYPSSFAPDGKHLAYVEYEGNRQIWTAPVEQREGRLKAGNPEQFLKSGYDNANAAFSPDGRWLAYDSNESGNDEVYVRAFPTTASSQGGKWQVSNNGGTQPHWSRSGHDLMYQVAGQIMAASYTVKGDMFAVEKPRVWISRLGGNRWDLSADGKRAAVITPVESLETSKQDHDVVFLMNFFDELRRKVLAAK